MTAFFVYDTGRFEWWNIPSFFICDSGYAQRYPLPGSFEVGVGPDWMTQADSLEELAQEMGIDDDRLATTIQRFNEYAETGVDLDWRRGETDFDIYTARDLTREELSNPCLAPLETSPFYGAHIHPGTAGINGGLRTNGDGQVLHVWGEVIPRLYCTGNAMASVMGGVVRRRRGYDGPGFHLRVPGRQARG